MNTELIARLRTDPIFDNSTLGNEAADALEAAQPAPQVPMTEADIALAMASVKDPMQWGHLKPQKVKALLIEYTRAIEAHHNIGAKP